MNTGKTKDVLCSLIQKKQGSPDLDEVVPAVSEEGGGAVSEK